MRKVEKKLNSFKAVIWAGGQGTRLYPITREIPKPLLPVNKKPIINYLVDLFHSYGVKDIAILISEDQFEDFVWWKKRYYPKNNILLKKEKEPLGTFGGLFFLKNWVGKNLFFFTNGDELKEINLFKMAEFHKKINPIATVALVETSNPCEYGVAVCDSNFVKEFIEKPKNPLSNYVNSGISLFSPKVFDYHPGPKFLMYEKDLFPILSKEKKLAGFKFKGKWIDTGTWERYSKALD